jgi:hypothetical protein
VGPACLPAGNPWNRTGLTCALAARSFGVAAPAFFAVSGYFSHSTKSPATRAGLIGNIFQDRQSARLTGMGARCPCDKADIDARKTTVPARMSGRCLSRHAWAQRPRFRVRQPFTGIIFPELLRRTTKARQREPARFDVGPALSDTGGCLRTGSNPTWCRTLVTALGPRRC